MIEPTPPRGPADHSPLSQNTSTTSTPPDPTNPNPTEPNPTQPLPPFSSSSYTCLISNEEAKSESERRAHRLKPREAKDKNKLIKKTAKKDTNKMADNFQEVAKQFVQFYYQQFDTDREQLAPLYRDTSMLTYESESMSGVVPIINKLKVRLLPTPPPLRPSPFCLLMPTRCSHPLGSE